MSQLQGRNGEKAGEEPRVAALKEVLVPKSARLPDRLFRLDDGRGGDGDLPKRLGLSSSKSR